jgi:hypothetical protein
MSQTITATTTRTPDCAPTTRVTKSLLGYGVIAGLFYGAVSLAQALTRDGFDLIPARVEPARQRQSWLDPDHQPDCDRPDGHRGRRRAAPRPRPGCRQHLHSPAAVALWADDLRGWATFSRITRVLFLGGFFALAVGGGLHLSASGKRGKTAGRIIPLNLSIDFSDRLHDLCHLRIFDEQRILHEIFPINSSRSSSEII